MIKIVSTKIASRKTRRFPENREKQAPRRRKSAANRAFGQLDADSLRGAG
jgi:hypothetical protein